MDPDKALEDLREIFRVRDCEMNDVKKRYDYANDPEVVERLHDLFEGLDRWMSLGGFLPKAWDRFDRARNKTAEADDCEDNIYCPFCGGLIWAPCEHTIHHYPGCAHAKEIKIE